MKQWNRIAMGLDPGRRGYGRCGSDPRPILDHPFTFIANPRELALSPGLGAIFGVPDFLWVAGDGNAPTIGPALSVTGTPTADVTPWQLADGSGVVSEEYDGASHRQQIATPIDPALGHDVVFACMVRLQPVSVSNYIFKTRNPGNGGIRIYQNTNNRMSAIIDDGSSNPIVHATHNGLHCWLCYVLVVDGDGNSWAHINSGAAQGTTATPSAGRLGDDMGCSIGGEFGGGNEFTNGSLAFLSWWTGAGIADHWTQAMVVDFCQRFAGIKPRQGANGAFARASAASFIDHDSIHHIVSDGMPRAGDSVGLRAEPTRTNKCYNTVNPQATTGWSVTGGTHTVSDDTAALATAKASAYGPNVHKFVPGAGDEVIYGGAATANTNKHAFSLLIRGDAGGEEAHLGFRDASGGGFSNVETINLTTTYQLVTVNNETPNDTDEVFALECRAGETVYFVAPQLEEGIIATGHIPNWATAATASRPYSDLTTVHTPDASHGSVELTVEPVGWSGAEAGVMPLLWLTSGGSAVLYVNAGGNWEADIDGTTQLDSTVAPADGVAQKIRLRWGSGMSIDVDGTRVSGAYDGSLLAAGTWQIVAGASCKVTNLRAYRNGGG